GQESSCIELNPIFHGLRRMDALRQALAAYLGPPVSRSSRSATSQLLAQRVGFFHAPEPPRVPPSQRHGHWRTTCARFEVLEQPAEGAPDLTRLWISPEDPRERDSVQRRHDVGRADGSL